MPQTLNHTQGLTVTECWCGMVHAIPTTLYDYVHRSHNNNKEVMVFCPLGHQWTPAGKSKLDMERERSQQLLDARNAAEAQVRAMQDQIDAAERERKRLAKRAAKGVCPCCKRSFVQLARHMAGQHPEYADEAKL